ncbi:hypothetical protein C0J52_25379, partial [Blattella germanica]
ILIWVFFSRAFGLYSKSCSLLHSTSKHAVYVCNVTLPSGYKQNPCPIFCLQNVDTTSTWDVNTMKKTNECFQCFPIEDNSMGKIFRFNNQLYQLQYIFQSPLIEEADRCCFPIRVGIDYLRRPCQCFVSVSSLAVILVVLSRDWAKFNSNRCQSLSSCANLVSRNLDIQEGCFKLHRQVEVVTMELLLVKLVVTSSSTPGPMDIQSVPFRSRYDSLPPNSSSIVDSAVTFSTTSADSVLNRDMLHRVWDELEYKLDICSITRGEQMEHLYQIEENLIAITFSETVPLDPKNRPKSFRPPFVFRRRPSVKNEKRTVFVSPEELHMQEKQSNANLKICGIRLSEYQYLQSETGNIQGQSLNSRDSGENKGKCIALIRVLRSCLNLNALLSFYFAHVESRLSYGICFWGSSPALCDLLSQKRVVRCMAGVDSRTSCKP